MGPGVPGGRDRPWCARESLHLTSEGQLVSTSGQDHTTAVTALAQRRRTELAGLARYVVKSRSPSCGLYSVRVHAGGQIVTGNGRGVFAERVLAADPLLPAEEGRLNDPLLREAFVEQVWARARLHQFFGGPWRLRDLIGFHARHKLQLMAHDPVRAHQAGHLVAIAHARPDNQVRAEYTALFGAALARQVSRARHCNAMHHAFGLVSDHLDDIRRRDILATIEAYRRGEVPLSVPVTLLRHHADGCSAVYLAAQTYLDPFPAGLGLRNHTPGPSAPSGKSGQSRQSDRAPAPKSSGCHEGSARMTSRRIAVIGSGVSGLTAGYLLARANEVTVFEADDRLGGHAHTHQVAAPDGTELAVDSGFIVCNERTYPLLTRLFAELGVTTQDAEMSMSVRCAGCGLEYAGQRGPAGLLAGIRRGRGRYLRMLADVVRFHREASRLAAGGHPAGPPSSPSASSWPRAGTRATSPHTSRSRSCPRCGPARRARRWITPPVTSSPSSPTTACCRWPARRSGGPSPAGARPTST